MLGICRDYQQFPAQATQIKSQLPFSALLGLSARSYSFPWLMNELMYFPEEISPRASRGDMYAGIIGPGQHIIPLNCLS